MKHETSHALYDYWTRLRGRRVAPQRHEIEPSQIRQILTDTFILEMRDRASYPFRLAGTRLCLTHGRELKGRNFLDLWQGRDREAAASLLSAIVEDGAAAVVGVEATIQRGQSVAAEILLLPLKHEGPHYTRLIGSYATMAEPYWLGLHPVVREPIQSLRLIWPDERPQFLRAAAGGSAGDPGLSGTADPQRRVGHLVVYEGGRGDGAA